MRDVLPAVILLFKLCCGDCRTIGVVQSSADDKFDLLHHYIGGFSFHCTQFLNRFMNAGLKPWKF